MAVHSNLPIVIYIQLNSESATISNSQHVIHNAKPNVITVHIALVLAVVSTLKFPKLYYINLKAETMKKQTKVLIAVMIIVAIGVSSCSTTKVYSKRTMCSKSICGNTTKYGTWNW